MPKEYWQDVSEQGELDYNVIVDGEKNAAC